MGLMTKAGSLSSAHVSKSEQYRVTFSWPSIMFSCHHINIFSAKEVGPHLRSHLLLWNLSSIKDCYDWICYRTADTGFIGDWCVGALVCRLSYVIKVKANPNRFTYWQPLHQWRAVTCILFAKITEELHIFMFYIHCSCLWTSFLVTWHDRRFQNILHSTCCIVGNLTCFSFLKSLHLSFKMPLQF